MTHHRTGTPLQVWRAQYQGVTSHIRRLKAELKSPGAPTTRRKMLPALLRELAAEANRLMNTRAAAKRADRTAYHYVKVRR